MLDGGKVRVVMPAYDAELTLRRMQLRLVRPGFAEPALLSAGGRRLPSS